VSVKPPDQNQLPLMPRNQVPLPETTSPLIQPSKLPIVFGASGGSMGGFAVDGSPRRLADAVDSTFRCVGPGSAEPTYGSKSIVQPPVQKL
jgi:hypothetical protein